MTRRRKQKKLIRDRMARTGQSYSSARVDVLRHAQATVVSTPVVMIPVSELSRAIAFYRDALGFSVRGRNAEGTWAEVGAGNTRIGLHAGEATRGVDTGLGLMVDDLSAACTAAQAHGGRVSDRPSPTLAIVNDPDGNALRLMEVRK